MLDTIKLYEANQTRDVVKVIPRGVASIITLHGHLSCRLLNLALVVQWVTCRVDSSNVPRTGCMSFQPAMRQDKMATSQGTTFGRCSAIGFSFHQPRYLELRLDQAPDGL